jgi:putative oxidoreductase
MSTTPAPPAPTAPRGGLHLGLWAAQVLLGLLFLGAGGVKLSTPLSELTAMGMTFVERSPEALVRFIGLSEVLGGVGLVVPAATRTLPQLTGVAAAALTLVMVLAAGEHALHGEISHLPPNFVLGGLTAFVAWGRRIAAPIPART